jgi:DNA modification methylase
MSNLNTQLELLGRENNNKLDVLSVPRKSIIESIFKDEFWNDSAKKLEEVLAQTSLSPLIEVPLDEDISAGKNTYTYDAHTYHTKVPPQGISKAIKYYLPQGGLVLDPFAGSGMTGVAALTLGHNVILNELSPAASFIESNFLNYIDPEKYKEGINFVLNQTKELREKLYTTDCRECAKKTEILYVVWSYELECNHCNGLFVLWDHCRKYGSNVKEHKLLKKFACPHCSQEVNKSYLNRVGTKPVFVGYKCCSRQIKEHPLNGLDIKTIQQSEELLQDYQGVYPELELPDGVNLNQPKRHGIKNIKDFYTARNLVACSSIWKTIGLIADKELASLLTFTFTSLYQRVTKTSEYRFWGGSSNTANFNIPQIFNEANVYLTFERKSKNILDHLNSTAKTYTGKAVVHTGSATNLDFLPDESIDLIFTDPPFGSFINYSEMNILWESWLGTFTDAKDEAIVSKTQNKGIDEYTNLMTLSLKEAYRVLKNGHWMVLVFMNSSEKVWSSLHKSIQDSGFIIEKVNIFDKKHGTFKQFVSENTAGADLMLHCKKDTSLINDIKKVDNNFNIETFLGNLSKEKIPYINYLHVEREREIDFRTLYSRYVAQSLSNGVKVIDFNDFRSTLNEILINA